MNHFHALATALTLALALPATASVAQEAGTPPTLVVSAEGRVAAAPDMATVTLGVVAESPEAAPALQQMSQSMQDVLDSLSAAGIAETDVQTTNLSLAPRWSDRRQNDAPARIEGFVASTDVSVRVRDLDGLGGLLDTVSRDGANRFHGVEFGLQSPQEAQDAATRAAVAEALRKAELLVDAAGLELGPILSIRETGGGIEPRMMRGQMDMAMASVAVASGEVDIRAGVTITWALADPAE